MKSFKEYINEKPDEFSAKTTVLNFYFNYLMDLYANDKDDSFDAVVLLTQLKDIISFKIECLQSKTTVVRNIPAYRDKTKKITDAPNPLLIKINNYVKSFDDLMYKNISALKYKADNYGAFIIMLIVGAIFCFNALALYFAPVTIITAVVMAACAATFLAFSTYYIYNYYFCKPEEHVDGLDDETKYRDYKGVAVPESANKSDKIYVKIPTQIIESAYASLATNDNTKDNKLATAVVDHILDVDHAVQATLKPLLARRYADYKSVEKDKGEFDVSLSKKDLLAITDSIKPKP